MKQSQKGPELLLQDENMTTQMSYSRAEGAFGTPARSVHLPEVNNV